ncbi:MAG: helix-turn-helix transcriptional regulator [Spirochaetales bacterium]|nr:helix-turn-helix transcriptional regulator [Spirochaetales bacterium]
MEKSVLKNSLISQINLIDKITRESAGFFSSESLPGHLIHIVESGRVVQKASGINEEISPSTAIWYYENEQISGEIIQPPWTFYTISFTAPNLAPPHPGQRVIPCGNQALEIAQELFLLWKKDNLNPMLRELKIVELFHKLLFLIFSEINPEYQNNTENELWWEIEKTAREDLSQDLNIANICRDFKISRKALNQSCQKATGKTPMKRIKELRLKYARGLIHHSNLNISEIAYSVGYTRVQELSRDYQKYFGKTPSQERKSTPVYK